MKIKHLLIGMLALAAAAACQEEVPEVEPVLEVDKTEVSVAATSAEATFNVTANNSWTATTEADWVTLDPPTGEGAAEAVAVKVTAEDNEATEARTATVTVKSGELTKTVTVNQAAAEPKEEVDPQPTPNPDWTSDKVVSYDLPAEASSKRQLLKNIKYHYDENYLYVKLQASVAEFEAAPAEYLGFFVYDVTDGSGDGYYGWWNDAKGNTEFEGEHIGVFNGKDIALTVGETPVEVTTAENGDELVWTLNILRSAHANLALENPHFAFLTYIGWEPNGALPDKYGDMLRFDPPAVEEPEPEPEPEYTLDGKQWLFAAEDMYVLVDLGLYEEEVMVIAVPLADGSGFGAYMYGTYEIEKTDNTSGKIVFTQYDPEWDEWMEPVDYAYSDLAETSVNIVAESLVGDTTPLPFTAVAEPYEIAFETPGGADPVGPIENGQYWFFNGTKVMAPLAEGVTTGTLPAGNVIDGASTEKNIFTLMYDPDWSYYTIMDSYGRYLGQTDETGNITVTDVLPTDETYAYYLWCVETGYGEACSIYNAAYYFDITYSAANNNWVLVDGGYEFPELLPTLVKAENPVEEPVEPAGPKVVTVAEFNAATDNTIEYQVSGTISGIYQAYNASYDNISIYISDETGEMLAYRLSCAGITDPANTLTKGDLITVKGMRTLYNENPQMAQGGVIVEHTDVVVETPVGSATLSFADKANRTSFTTSQQIWEQNGIKLINDKGSSTSNVADYAAPARFYKSSMLTVEYAGMTKIEFTCNNGSYATALQSSITSGTVSVNGSVVTVVLDAAADSYVISSLTGGQVRMDSLTVYAE